MNTSYKEIYDIFVNKITDFNFLNLLPDDIEELCLKYLKSAITKFIKCKKDLSERSDILQVFYIELDDIEKEILGTMMVVEWLTPQVYNIMNTKQFLGDKEYKYYSQANHLDKLIKLRDTSIEDGERLIILYTYSQGGLGELK